jgi:hypothetical protein
VPAVMGNSVHLVRTRERSVFTNDVGLRVFHGSILIRRRQEPGVTRLSRIAGQLFTNRYMKLSFISPSVMSS